VKCCAKSRSRKTAGVKRKTKQTNKKPTTKALGRKDFIEINIVQFQDRCTGTSTQEWSLVAAVNKAKACERGASQDLTVLAWPITWCVTLDKSLV